MPLPIAAVLGLLAMFSSGLVQADIKNHALVLHKEVLSQGKAIYKVNE